MIERYRPAPLPPPAIVRKTWYQMTHDQQRQAKELIRHHAVHVEYVTPAEYLRYVKDWQIDQSENVVGWISGRPETAKQE